MDSLKDLFKPEPERSEYDTRTMETAQEVLPGLYDHRKAPEYREDTVVTFLNMERDTEVRNGQLYSADGCRLLDTWTEVAMENSTSEANIRNCVLRMYDQANEEELGPVSEFDTMTEQFLEDLKEIEARLKQESS